MGLDLYRPDCIHGVDSIGISETCKWTNRVPWANRFGVAAAA